jgi:hypothetical protein
LRGWMFFKMDKDFAQQFRFNPHISGSFGFVTVGAFTMPEEPDFHKAAA